MELRSYTLEELGSRKEWNLQDRDTLRSVSPLRYSSYMHNPRANPGDRVLFEMWNEDRLIAFRTLLPDVYFDPSGNPQRFAWLSGNYVDPDYRRQGISTRLLQTVEEAWEGRLMYTNYAPASKAVYDKSGKFQLLTRRDGSRFYLRSSLGELLAERWKYTGILNLGDRLVNWLTEQKRQNYKDALHVSGTVSRIQEIDSHLLRQLTLPDRNSLFRREEEVFRWILDYPWVSDRETEYMNFPFSYRARHFENHLFRMDHPDSGGTGFLWLVLYDRKISAPYLFFDDAAIVRMAADILLETMISTGSAFTTVRHPELVSELGTRRSLFLSVRPMPQSFFIHQSLANNIPDRFTLQDGDGDVVFTG